MGGPAEAVPSASSDRCRPSKGSSTKRGYVAVRLKCAPLQIRQLSVAREAASGAAGESHSRRVHLLGATSAR